MALAAASCFPQRVVVLPQAKPWNLGKPRAAQLPCNPSRVLVNAMTRFSRLEIFSASADVKAKVLRLVGQRPEQRNEKKRDMNIFS